LAKNAASRLLAFFFLEYLKMKHLINKCRSGALGIAASLSSVAAFAQTAPTGPDMSNLTSAVDFGTVTTALLGVAAALIVVYIAWKGAKIILTAVKSG
jgi:hypothetical protein